jgi:hypothetical protein
MLQLDRVITRVDGAYKVRIAGITYAFDTLRAAERFLTHFGGSVNV